ncbi:MAG: DegQ family serine endoprotease [Betaproteobacteria bacterium]|nr:DegQ family serine endoprotease [Betaproteobacteria bacterium]MDH5221774.1 DegQ family serine endoprotease [Betaproteobacteria bacterium]MDH5350055.1 DegQ family serine endoprotease [Betaproteobacteria bacterium]
MTLNRIAATLAATGVLVLAGLAVSHTAGLQPAQAAPAPATAAATTRVSALPDFAAIVRQYGPAVVNIATSGTRQTAGAQVPLPDFFRGLPFRFQAPQGEVPVQGQGSGFIVDADGIVLTNAHVVQNATEVTVKLTDRREFRAKVLGTDPATDVAVLRIEAKNLPAVRLGEPDRAQVGDWVVAIGSPFGFENSVTAGIVSAKSRSLPGDTYVPFIQTDVAVNPGNSGGPLFNLAGEVIGINSQIYSRSGGYQGLSFAIPIDVALRVKDQIVATGHASHARLGVNVQTMNQALAESFGLERPEGALVAAVAPGSAADKAGLQPGDVVLKFNGRAVGDSGELAAMVGESSPGAQARLEVWRKGGKRELLAILGSSSDDKAQKANAEESADQGRLGLAVRPLTPQESDAAHVPGGLLVEGVNGPAARAGVAPGDIVLQAAGKPVRSVEDLRAAATAGKTVALLVQRGERRLFVPLQAG